MDPPRCRPSWKRAGFAQPPAKPSGSTEREDVVVIEAGHSAGAVDSNWEIDSVSPDRNRVRGSSRHVSLRSARRSNGRLAGSDGMRDVTGGTAGIGVAPMRPGTGPASGP